MSGGSEQAAGSSFPPENHPHPALCPLQAAGAQDHRAKLTDKGSAQQSALHDMGTGRDAGTAGAAREAGGDVRVQWEWGGVPLKPPGLRGSESPCYAEFPHEPLWSTR